MADVRRSVMFNFRVTPEEAQHIEEAVAKSPMKDRSDWIRASCLGSAIGATHRLPPGVEVRHVVAGLDPGAAVQVEREWEGGPPPELTKLVKQLEAQGKTPSEASSLARKRLGL